MATGLSAALSEVVRPERLHVLGACRLRVIKSGELPGEPSSEKHLARPAGCPVLWGPQGEGRKLTCDLPPVSLSRGEQGLRRLEGPPCSV
ncbi:unnamed protein product [Rangifer tarandus platyrhynchus]|uniref:Uncharacterized protein n=1 Tax=Rangifer tarandus platyrhynchus TaxID=3082113 RepID=A0AC59Z6C0_RANTA